MAPVPPAPLRRVGWKPKLSLMGLLGGLLMGISVMVLLQQLAILYAEREVFLAFSVGGTVLGGIVVPSIFRTIAVNRINAAIQRAEARREQQPPAAPAGPPPGPTAPPAAPAGPPGSI
ncbi:MAG: hypothetical protein QOE92_1355 [Chloroflexota bacterium]|jgi:hypothetical protein|nr:hypothetical protein [Chloroflexota bacterium]